MNREQLLKRTKEDGECLIWTGSLVHGNAPVFSEGGKKLYAKRRILEDGGIRIDGKCVTSICGNKLCVCPTHLIATTKAGISRRTAATGAWSTLAVRINVAKGKRNKSKLTQESVREIRASEQPAKLIAQTYGITPAYVYMMRRGDSRKDYQSPFSGLGAR